MAQLAGVRARWRTEALGEFFCPACGGDRNYRRQGGRRWLRLLGLPLLPLGDAGTTLQCTACRARYGLDALGIPTSGTLLGMLRTAQFTVVLAVLAAGGACRAAREAAVTAVHEAGHSDLDEPQLLAALAALTDGDEELGELYGCGSGLAVELHTALEPLVPHLAEPGRERLLTLGAWIALADGPYRPDEREALRAAGRCLELSSERIEAALLAATRLPHS
ncbi:TerB family tellurite resistance protein [Streptacidiphilus cavernicola]|uniref:TerB family tellurite resistance protein n=1 Tax=Streptacidiphilus cavernicola TaxID=3342716 RepID=A0ABV6VRX9_9ACTN